MFKGRHKSSYKELKKRREEYDDEDNLYGGKKGLKEFLQPLKLLHFPYLSYKHKHFAQCNDVPIVIGEENIINKEKGDFRDSFGFGGIAFWDGWKKGVTLGGKGVEVGWYNLELGLEGGEINMRHCLNLVGDRKQ